MNILRTKKLRKISLNNTRLLTSKSNKDNNSNSKSLVTYGSNLGSTLGMSRLPNNLRSLIYLTSPIYSITVGPLLSDGWLEKYSSNSNARFRFKQSIDKCLYVLTSYFHLSHYCSSLPYIKVSKYNKLY